MAEIDAWARVHPSVVFGLGVKVYQFATICEGTTIASEAVIGSNVWIGRNCRIGNGVRIQDGAHITNGVIIEDDVFVGPRIVTGDDKHPRVRNPNYKPEPPIFRKGCVIGMGATILPGVEIGEGAMVAGGAIITKDVPAGVTALGQAARFRKTA